MIVLDTSALVAILKNETECETFLEIISQAERRLISTITLLEIRVVMRGRHGQAGVDDLAALLEEIAPLAIPFDETQSRLAANAFDRFGKGIDPKARLNICDCASYALARAMDAPLLFKGEDFLATDVKSCRWP